MAHDKYDDLSTSGNMLMRMLELVEHLVPDIAKEIEPDYKNKTPTEKAAINETARRVISGVFLGVMKR